jgi:uncharacterized phiE125 gp8 family phage protein
LKTGNEWPDYTEAGCGVKVTFIAGYGDAATSIPDDIVLAVKMTVAHWMENRESQELPPEVKRILNAYQVPLI